MNPLTAHCMALRRILLVALMLLGSPLAGQTQGAGPRARMREFVEALQGDRAQLEDFFPRRDPWAWIVTTRSLSGRVTVERREFLGSETLAAMEHPGPLCETFAFGGDVGSVESLMHRLRMDPLRWRLVDGRRFVPPRASPRSATFVEWRREDRRWVVSAIGEERTAAPRLLGRPVNRLVRDSTPGEAVTLPLPADAAVAAGTRWFAEYAPIIAGNMMLTAYGLPRAVPAEFLTRIGTVNGVAAYVETGAGLEVVYIPVTRDGSFQMYQFMTSSGCP
ncbi:MAG TPA: hypothetical protein VGB24_05470 [Longimicrobium sp.]|jgi:hypothetical protein|uniref:hypothetical protein n=1 Tax=Longimicrobium sp. TaxID=2029185 RepID=UPI002ED8A637